jgi:hypothetical protein
MASRVFDAITAIIEMLETAGANVIDGPTTTGDTQDKVNVGYDGDPEGEWLAAQLDQEWAGIGDKRRDETFDVICAVVSEYSADSAKDARERVRVQFALVEAAILTDPSLGLPQPTIAGVHPTQLFAEVGQYRLTFVIRVKTRV